MIQIEPDHLKILQDEDSRKFIDFFLKDVIDNVFQPTKITKYCLTINDLSNTPPKYFPAKMKVILEAKTPNKNLAEKVSCLIRCLDECGLTVEHEYSEDTHILNIHTEDEDKDQAEFPGYLMLSELTKYQDYTCNKARQTFLGMGGRLEDL